MKLILKQCYLAAIALGLTFTIFAMSPTAHGFETQASTCSICHSPSGQGMLSITDTSGVEKNRFTVDPQGNVTIVVHGRGDLHQGYSKGPAVAMELGPVLYDKIIVAGAKPSGKGSDTYYVQDGDENDKESSVNDVKALFVIRPSPDIPARNYQLTIHYVQKGPSSKSSTIILEVAGKETPTVPTLPLPTVKQELDCLQCHQTQLKKHDKLGTGNAACTVCHDSFDMTKLRLVNGTNVPLKDAPLVCRQCHQDKYAAWSQGMHGKYGPYYAKVEGRVLCSKCHDPHAPPFSTISPLPPQFETSTSSHTPFHMPIVDGWLAIIVIVVIATTAALALTKRGLR